MSSQQYRWELLKKKLDSEKFRLFDIQIIKSLYFCDWEINLENEFMFSKRISSPRGSIKETYLTLDEARGLRNSFLMLSSLDEDTIHFETHNEEIVKGDKEGE